MKKGMRVYWTELGGHMHVSVFAGNANAFSFGKCGDLILTNEEFAAWKNGTIEMQFVSVKKTTDADFQRRVTP